MQQAVRNAVPAPLGEESDEENAREPGKTVGPEYVE